MRLRPLLCGSCSGPLVHRQSSPHSHLNLPHACTHAPTLSFTDSDPSGESPFFVPYWLAFLVPYQESLSLKVTCRVKRSFSKVSLINMILHFTNFCYRISTSGMLKLLKQVHPHLDSSAESCPRSVSAVSQNGDLSQRPQSTAAQTYFWVLSSVLLETQGTVGRLLSNRGICGGSAHACVRIRCSKSSKQTHVGTWLSSNAQQFSADLSALSTEQLLALTTRHLSSYSFSPLIFSLWCLMPLLGSLAHSW